jgi:DHA1 family bicyclomycin/chloramphenicol resistance-like MFS transporter
MGVAPILAPSIGGLVMTAFGWRSVFGILFVFSAVTGTIAYFRLPESRSESERARSRAESIRSSIAAILSNRRFLGYALGGSLVTFAMFAYIGSASDVFINMYGFTPSLFGLAFSLNAGGYIAAAQVNRSLLRRYSSDQILRVATWIGCGAGLWILCDAFFGIGGAAGLLAPIFVVCSALGILQPNALAGAMTTDPHRTGTISALFGMMQAGAGAVGASLSAALHNGTPLPMALIIAGGFFSALIMYRVLPPWPQRRVEADS